MRVLYATDGLPPAASAGDLIERIGDRARLEIDVLSVVYEGFPSPQHLPFVLDPIEARREDALEIAEEVAGKLKSAGFQATPLVREGDPSREILKVLSLDSYELVVLGAGGRSWLGKRLLGSVSTYVLHDSPVSVLIAHTRSDDPARTKILFATDGSEGSKIALETLAGFADAASHEVTVLSTAPDPIMLLAPAAAPIPVMLPRIPEEAHDQLRAIASEAVELAARALADTGFVTRSLVAEGHPADEILKEEAAGDYDLVALGSRGLGPVRRALLGSVGDHVARYAGATLVGRKEESRPQDD